MTTTAPAILLDLDGTLVNSQPGILSSCRAALRALGHDPPAEMNIESVIGPPMVDVMTYLLSPYGDGRVPEAIEAFRKDYGDRGLLMSELYPGVRQALDAIRAIGGRLFLATSKRSVFARRILDNHGLAADFAGIYGSEPGGAVDHKPELLARILRENGLGPDQCVMVGDRRFDISGAHTNHVRAIGVLWGYGRREELETAGADLIIEETGELANAAMYFFR